MHLTAQRDGNNLDVELAGTWRGTDLPAIDAELAGVSLAGVSELRIAVPEALELDLAGAWTLRQWTKAAEETGVSVQFTGAVPGQLELIERKIGSVHGSGMLTVRDVLDAVSSVFTSYETWLGVLAAAAMIFGAIRIRRYRDDS